MPELRAEHIRVLTSLVNVLTARANRAREQGNEEEAATLEAQAKRRRSELTSLIAAHDTPGSEELDDV